MKRTPIYTVAISAVLFIVYSLIVFLFKEEKGTAFWIAYICTLVALIIAEGMAAWMTANGKKKVTFLQVPVYRYCSIFIIVQLVVGLVLALFVSGIKAVVIIEVILYAIFLLFLLATLQGKTLLENKENELADSTRFINELRLEVENLYMSARGTASERKLKELSDAVRYSDPVSSSSLQQIENELAYAVQKLKSKMSENPENIAAEVDNVLRILGERNRSCKALK